MMSFMYKRTFRTACTVGMAALTGTLAYKYQHKHNIFAEGKTEPPKNLPPVRKIKLIDDKLKLVPTEAEFNEFVKGYGCLFVVAVTGGYGQGKSTLINELYEDQLQGMRLETSDKDD